MLNELHYIEMGAEAVPHTRLDVEVARAHAHACDLHL